MSIRLINRSFYLFIRKFALKHYIKITYEVILQLQGLCHMNEIVFYHFYTLNIICLHHNYTHKLSLSELSKCLTMLSN